MLDDEQVRAREEQARAALAQAEARARRRARPDRRARSSSCGTRSCRPSSRRSTRSGRVRQAEADLAAAEAQLAQQQAAYQLALFDKDAYTQLARDRAPSQSVRASRRRRPRSSRRRRWPQRSGASRRRRARWRRPRPNLTNPDIRDAGERRRAQPARAAAGRGRRARWRRSSRRARSWPRREANREDLTVRAPFAGTDRHARRPSRARSSMAGTPIVTLVDLTQRLPARIRAGRTHRRGQGRTAGARLPRLRSRTSRSRPSSRGSIPQATFTPENTYFREDRVKQVVGVKLQLKGAVGFAKPGMPADGEILVRRQRGRTAADA